MNSVLDKVEYRIINDRIFKALFINNENALAKLIADLTDIPYDKLKDNIVLEINEIPIIYKGEKFKRSDFIVSFDNFMINIEANVDSYVGQITKNLSYVFTLYGRGFDKGEKYRDNKMIIQINLNAFSEKKNKDYLVDYMIRDKNGDVYIDNLKIFNLDIVKCYDMYYNCGNLDNLSNSTKWGAFLWSSCEDSNVCDILDGVLDKKEVDELKLRLEGLNMNAHGIMSRREAKRWGEWIKNAMIDSAKKEAIETGIKEGRKEGISEGKELAIIDTIKAMIQNDIDIDTISKVTGKSINEINEIKYSKKD